jgi:hypothetical protein
MPNSDDLIRQQQEFSDQISRAPNEVLENTLRYGGITASRWRTDIVIRELRARQRDGMYDPTPAVRASPPPPTLKFPPITAERPTSWSRLLNGDD